MLDDYVYFASSDLGLPLDLPTLHTLRWVHRNMTSQSLLLSVSVLYYCEQYGICFILRK